MKKAFEKGAKVRIKKNGYPEEYQGKVITLKEGHFNQSRVWWLAEENELGWRERELDLIKEAKMSIKDKIENINEDTTIKELDDLIEEAQNGKWTTLRILDGECDQIRISTTKGDGNFDYTDQCSKLQALKDALLWLAKKSGKLKDNKKEIKELREEIEAIRDNSSAKVELLLKKIERLEE